MLISDQKACRVRSVLPYDQAQRSIDGHVNPSVQHSGIPLTVSLIRASDLMRGLSAFFPLIAR